MSDETMKGCASHEKELQFHSLGNRKLRIDLKERKYGMIKFAFSKYQFITSNT